MTRHPISQLALPLCMLLACRPEDPGRDDFYLGGIQVNEPDRKVWVQKLAQVGMNTVAATVYAEQGAWDSADLRFDEDYSWVIDEAKEAKKAGLEVVLILRVKMDESLVKNRFLWHGMIRPSTEERQQRWFERYGSFVEEWAQIAEEVGIDVLGIGSEMSALAATTPVEGIPNLEEYYLNPEKQEGYKNQIRAQAKEGQSLGADADHYKDLESFLEAKVRTYESWARVITPSETESPVKQINAYRASLEQAWIQVIERARAVYSGKLTYAANFDEYTHVGFWEHLDLIGINAYFPIRRRFLAEEERDLLPGILEQGWQGVFDDIDAFRRREGVGDKPLIFTELGYTERQNCTMAPWAMDKFNVIWGTPEGGGSQNLIKRLVVWEDQPLDLDERVAAIAALRRVAARRPETLAGLLYWKLSTQISDRRWEPFLAVLDEEDPSWPLVQELRRFRYPEE